MCKKQHLTHFRSLLAIATIAVGLVAGQSVPAAAHVGVAMQPDRARREQMPMHRNVNYAPVRPARTYASTRRRTTATCRARAAKAIFQTRSGMRKKRHAVGR